MGGRAFYVWDTRGRGIEIAIGVVSRAVVGLSSSNQLIIYRKRHTQISRLVRVPVGEGGNK